MAQVAAAAWTGSLYQELSYATGVAKKKKKNLFYLLHKFSLKIKIEMVIVKVIVSGNVENTDDDDDVGKEGNIIAPDSQKRQSVKTFTCH